MIEVENLSKRYGQKLAVDGLGFVVRPGVVTGFLGPNGAGKPATMRMIAGLDQLTAGRVRVNGRDYRAAPAPMAELGILLEARAMHTGRSARLRELLLGPGITVTSDQPGVLHVRGRTAEQIGAAACRARLPVFELTPRHASLEEAFMRLTDDAVDFRAYAAAGAVPAR